ncbi:response regulator transcription factor [Actinokineospora enzanensis]|uniref:response regulator transcription factor n=1 Tax=Actinokineospora enzanensis TaxID=155975 RepID=UPI00036D996F|nr:response regulator transcription factor [Actinokineospora enzanensis]
MIRVFIVDDQAMVRESFAALLDAQPGMAVVGTAGDGIGAQAGRRADVVLMDVRMPGVDGIEATRRLLAGPDPRPRVIILTTFHLDEYVHDALRAGASGFLLKDAPATELIRAVEVVAAGEALLSPAITKRLISVFAQHAPPRPAPDTLTPRELEILLAVAKGLSNAEIATALGRSELTVKTHVSRILTKLDLRDRAQAIVLAYETGLVTPTR